MPSAGNPQALNRYAYVFNNPLKFTDPSGHCPGDGDKSQTAVECRAERDRITNKYNIKITGNWREKKYILSLEKALANLVNAMGGGDTELGMQVFASIWGGTEVNRSELSGKDACGDEIAGGCQRGRTVILTSGVMNLGLGFNWAPGLDDFIAHEFGHVWDWQTNLMNGRGSYGMAERMGVYTGSRCLSGSDAGCTKGNWFLGPSGNQIPNSYARSLIPLQKVLR